MKEAGFFLMYPQEHSGKTIMISYSSNDECAAHGKQIDEQR